MSEENIFFEEKKYERNSLTLLEINEVLNVKRNNECGDIKVAADDNVSEGKGEVTFSNSCCSNDKCCSREKNNNSNESVSDFDSEVVCKLPTQNEQQDIYLVDALFEKGGVVSPNCEETLSLQDLDESLQPLTERWSPLGANYDDTMSPNGSELMSPESELELLSLSGSPKKRDLIHNDPGDISRLRYMEEEQELLTTSLLALTSHFAHVQLRVRQIVEASPDERDQLLKDLDKFAFQGIPEPMSSNVITNAPKLSSKDNSEIDEAITRQRQCELIEHLKSQLSELEKLAYESGAPVLPQHILLEKQKVIIDELKNKLNLKVEEHELPQLSSEELKYQVDNAIGEFVGPLKMKEQLVAQLKTQITDLERFIFFLQCDSDGSKMKTLNSSNEKFTEAYNSYAAKKKRAATQNASKQGNLTDEYSIQPQKPSCSHHPESTVSQGVRESLNSKAHGLMDKASVLMQMFATTHFGAKPDSFQKNTLKKTSKGNHWGDLRAQLEVDIQEVASLAATLSCDREKLKNLKLAMKSAQMAKANASNIGTSLSVQPFSNRHIQAPTNVLKLYALSSDSDEDTYDCYDWHQNVRRARYKGDSVNAICRELTTAVRKNFAMTLQRLMQHGLREETSSAANSLMVPFLRCFNPSPRFAADQESYRGTEFGNPPSFVAYDASGVSQKRDEYEDGGESGFFRGSGNSIRPMHAWELILEYYFLKNGDEFNNTPARKLSESFNLEIIDSKAVTAKQNLLTTIGSIIAMHRSYKRSCNAHFKAFICAGLNAKQLVEWLNLIFSCNNLIETYYTTNSYVMRTGFRDSLRSIDTLTKYDFDLPVDLAVRHFKNI